MISHGSLREILINCIPPGRTFMCLLLTVQEQQAGYGAPTDPRKAQDGVEGVPLFVIVVTGACRSYNARSPNSDCFTGFAQIQSLGKFFSLIITHFLFPLRLRHLDLTFRDYCFWWLTVIRSSAIHLFEPRARSNLKPNPSSRVLGHTTTQLQYAFSTNLKHPFLEKVLLMQVLLLKGLIINPCPR